MSIRLLSAAFVIFLVWTTAGCGPVFVVNYRPTSDVVNLDLSLVVVGKIEHHQFESWPFFRIAVAAGAHNSYWRVLRRRVRIEHVLFGREKAEVLDVYEVAWTRGRTGDWNSTRDGERALFPLRMENGYYRGAIDQQRSIFPVTTGPHKHLPLGGASPLWERIALLNWSMEDNGRNAEIVHPYFLYSDPGATLSLWRKVKLARGLLRHPSSGVRVPACRELLRLGRMGQDECWDLLTEAERQMLRAGGSVCCTAEEVAARRRKLEEFGAERWWRNADRETRRLGTAMSSRPLRASLCRWYEREYPGDHDTGCPADRPPPATIVTEQGDVPLPGAWPLAGAWPLEVKGQGRPPGPG